MGVGELIKNYRDEHGLSLREFAEKARLSHSYIDKLESGKDPTTGKPVTPTLRTIDSIAKALEMTTKELMVAAGHIEKTEPQSHDYDIFMRVVGKLSPEGKDKVYDFIEMVDNMEKQKRKRKKRK